MRIQFDATVDEFIEVQERTIACSKVARAWRREGTAMSALFTGLIAAVPLFIFAYFRWSWLPAVVAAGVTFLLAASLTWATHADRIRRRLHIYFQEQFGDRDTFPFELELRETGIWTNQLGVQNLFEWANVEEMSQTEETIEFYMYGGGAVFVRKRAFASTEEHQRFIDIARQRLMASRTSSNWLRDG